MKEKLILTDCDGVLVDWMYSFDMWMRKHGYKIQNNASHMYSIKERYDIGMADKSRLTRMFNESAWIRKIPPHLDAIKYVRKLHEEHGYVFHVITSQTDVEYAQHLRVKNLCELFGPTAFEKFIILDCGADKDEALEPYRDSGCYWLEDKMSNCDLGVEMGLDGILMAQDYNYNYEGPGLRLNNWREIYNLITGL